MVAEPTQRHDASRQGVALDGELLHDHRFLHARGGKTDLEDATVRFSVTA